MYKDCILADTGAGTSIFYDESLLSNIRRKDEMYRVRGIGNSIINVSLEGDSVFGTVGYHKQSGMNILSIGEILDDCFHIEINRKDKLMSIQMYDKGPVYNFRRIDNQFICDLKKDVIKSDDDDSVVDNVYMYYAGVSTVEERKRLFSDIEVIRAEEARELQRKLAYPSAGTLIKEMQLGKVETKLTPTDVINGVYIFGKSLGECKGKTTASKQESETPVPTQFTGVRRFQHVYIDIMYESGLKFLIMVFEPLDYIIVGLIKTEKAVDIWPAMAKGLREVYNKGFNVTIGYIDGQKATQTQFLQQQVWLHFGFEIDISGAAEAIPIVEAKIRRVKERMRCVYHVLPFDIDLLLMAWLTRYSAVRLNGELSTVKRDGLTARERLHARRNDKNWIRHGFGDYCQVHDKYTNNQIKKARTQGALALCPTGNLAGTWYYLNLKTWKVIARNGATNLPMPQEVIEYINYKVQNKKKALLEDLEPVLLEHEVLPEDNIAMQQPELIIPDDAGEVIEGDMNDDVDKEPDEGELDLINQTQEQTVTNTDSEGTTEVYEHTDIDVNNTNNTNNMENTEVEMVPEHIVNDIVDNIDQYGRVEGPEPGLLRSERIRRRKLLQNMLTITIDKFVGLGLQMELHEARRKYGARAVIAAADEIKQLLRKKVFRGVTLEEQLNEYDTKPIPSSMKIKEKFQGEILTKLKGRLTGGGHKMNKELFQDIKYAPTVTTTSVMAAAVIGAHENRAIATLDFTGAFLYADMPTDRQKATLVKLGQFLTRMLVKLDPEYEQYVREDGTCVVVLDKALYGTIIAAAAWYKKISGDMKNLGYNISKYDNAVFYKDILNKNILVLLHVDDMKFLALGGEKAIDIAINEIQSKYDETTVNRGKVFTYLGIDFDYSIPGEVTLSMTHYVNNTIKIYEDKYGELSTYKTPASDDIFKLGDVKLNDDMSKDYHSQVMRLQYLGKHQRYNIVFPISILNKRVRAPTTKDWEDLQRVLGFIKYKKDQKLILRANNLDTVTSYIDASFGVHADMKGHGGCITLIGNAPVDIKSSTGKLNTKSSTEEELCHVYDHSNRPIWLRNFLNEIGYAKDAAIIKQDNISTLHLIHEGRAKALSTKHINRRYFYIKDVIDRNEIRLEYCRTDLMLADILTKPLQGYLFERLEEKIMNCGHVNLKPLPKRVRKVRFVNSVYKYHDGLSKYTRYYFGFYKQTASRHYRGVHSFKRDYRT